MKIDCPCTQFTEITIDDIDLVHDYLRRADYRNSDYNMLGLLLWKYDYHIWQYHTDNWMLIMGQHHDLYYVMMPLCTPEYFSEALAFGHDAFESAGIPFTMTTFTQEGKDLAIKQFPQYQVEQDRDVADYVYLTESLRTFAGKKLQRKRNRLNKFYQTYAGRWQYEELDAHNLKECNDFLQGWEAHKEKREDTAMESLELNYEYEGMEKIIPMKKSLGWVGGVIRIDGAIRAFLIATRLASDMAQINIEKADIRFDGLYQAVLKEFLKDNFLDCEYVNREDDMGSEKLRQSKLAYNPIKMIEKYRISEVK